MVVIPGWAVVEALHPLCPRVPVLDDICTEAGLGQPWAMRPRLFWNLVIAGLSHYVVDALLIHWLACAGIDNSLRATPACKGIRRLRTMFLQCHHTPCNGSAILAREGRLASESGLRGFAWIPILIGINFGEKLSHCIAARRSSAHLMARS